MNWRRTFDRWLGRLGGHPLRGDDVDAQPGRRIRDRSERGSMTGIDGQPLVPAQNPPQAGIVRTYVRERCVGVPSVVTAYAVEENEIPQIIAGEGASGCFSIGHGFGHTTATGPGLLTAASTSVFRANAVAPALRDEGGRYVSPHRLAVRARCREQCAKIGREVPEALR